VVNAIGRENSTMKEHLMWSMPSAEKTPQ